MNYLTNCYMLRKFTPREGQPLCVVSYVCICTKKIDVPRNMYVCNCL